MRLLTLLLCFQLCFFSQLQAEPSGLGRLPDGRAYRTDAAGNEIVDLVAELELQLKSKEQQLIALEDDLERERERSARLQSSGGKDPEVRERTLVGKSDTGSSSSRSQDLRRIYILEEQLARLRAENHRLTKGRSAQSSASKVASETTKRLEELRKVNAAQKEKIATISEREQRERYKTAALEKELSKFKNNARQRDEQLVLHDVSLRQNLESEQKKVRGLEEELSKVREELKLALAQDQRASRKADLQSSASSPRASLGKATAEIPVDLDPAVASLRGVAKTEINKVSQKIVARDHLKTQYLKQGRRPELLRLKADARALLSQYKSELQKSYTRQSVQQVMRDVKRLSSNIDSDIQRIKSELR